MQTTIAGFPGWLVEYDARGRAVDDRDVDAFVRSVSDAKLTDLFIFAHGWNNDPVMASSLYEAFFSQMRAVADDAAFAARRAASIGVVGVVWPSIRWPDSELEDLQAAAGEMGGGAASVGGGDAAGAPSLQEELGKVFVTPEQQVQVAELVAMLEEQAPSEEVLAAFHAKLAALLASDPAADEAPDQAPDEGAGPAAGPAAGPDAGTAERTAIDALERDGLAGADVDWRETFDVLADQEESDSTGGAAGLGDFFGRMWRGAKGALRVATYWQMKKRAGLVGRDGLGPLIGRLHQQTPALRIHLLGHSFGARLVSFALAGLPKDAVGAASPVKSVFLLQGAFSHFAFADALPFDTGRKGDLAGMAARVDGPLLSTHSLHDTAVGTAYPLASFVARQDAADAGDRFFRWGAIGHDGAQGVNAAGAPLGDPGTRYPFAPGRWINLDGNAVITRGGPPSGAHSDIAHPHTAWAALCAAGLR
jgi:hypothetical protein